MSTSYNRDAFADLMGQLALQAQEGSTTFTGGGFGKSNVGMQISPGGFTPSPTTPAEQAAQADPYAADPDFRFYDPNTYNVSAGSPLDYYIQNPFGQSIGDTYSFIGPQVGDFTVPTGGTGVGSALSPVLNFDSLGGNDVEQITVTGTRGTDPISAIGVGNLNLTPTDLNLGDQALEEEEKRPIEEILVTGVREAANTLVPGLSLMSSGYDFLKELPEGDFTPEELTQLEQADTAANVFVDSQATFPEGGTGTTATPGGVNVPGLGIGSLGGSRGFVGTQDVLVPATGQMGSIYSIRPGDTRGRFAAPAYVNPYADVAAQDTALRAGFVPAAPIAAAPGTSVTDQGTQTTDATTGTTTGAATGQVTGTATDVVTPRVLPQDILANINAEDGFSRDEQQQIADLLTSGEIGIGNVTQQFDVESGDVLEGLLRGGFQTPEQLTEMIRGYGNEGFQEQDLIADLLNQGRTTPEEVAAYYSANRPEFADLTPEAVTGYLDEINTQRLQGLSDVEVGKLIDSGQMTPSQAVEIYQTRYPGLKESDVMASLNQMKAQGMFAMGGVVEKSDGIESLLDKRQQAVNRMLSRRAVAQFRDGGPVVKKSLAPANFAGGGIATKLIQKGAEMLGFDDARQIEITREAVDLTNQMVDAGLVDPKFRVKLRMPTSGEPSTRQNTGIEGDEEVFNAVNHALFSYHAGKSPLARAGSQAKEIYQGIRLAGAGKDPGSESLDYFNNLFGFELARQGLSPEEAKSAIIDNIANINNQGAKSRLLAGEPLVAGKDLSRTAEDIRGSGPDVTAFDVLAGVQGFQNGGAALDPSDPLYIQEDYRPEVISDMIRREVKFDPSKYPTEELSMTEVSMQRLRDIGQGFADIPEFVGNYLVRPDEKGLPTFVSPTEVASDVITLGSGMATAAKEDPTGFVLDMIPGVSNVRALMDSNKLYEQAAELDKQGDQLQAAKTRSLASMSMTGVFNPIPGGKNIMRGIIAGKSAQKAPEKLSDVRLDELERSADPALEQEVFREKGSFIGANGDRQFEIDTTPAQVDISEIAMMQAFGNSLPLTRLLDLPELYENYPQLADVQVELGSGDFVAQYYPQSNRIVLNPANIPPDPKAVTSSMLHETQHAVQNIEGYLRPELFRAGELSFEEYQGLPTEVEARNIQGRYIDPSLRDLPPTSTVDLGPENFSDVSALRDRVNRAAYEELMESNERSADMRKPPSADETMEDVLERIRQNILKRNNVPRGTIRPEGQRGDPFEPEADTRSRQKNPKR